MRIFLLLAANAALIGFLLFEGNALERAGDTAFLKAIKGYYYNKEIRLRGNLRLSDSNMRAILPREKPLIWWLSNIDEIEKLLIKNPIIKESKVTKCGWNCFEIEVQERAPSFIALLAGSPWLLGQDGGFIAPLDSLKAQTPPFKITTEDISRAVRITGLLEKRFSPDVLEAKISYLSEVIRVIQKNLSLAVEELNFNSDSDLQLRFKGHLFSAKFNSPKAEIPVIEDQSLRLKRILSAYSGRINEIKEVDLAYNQIAVVKTDQSIKAGSSHKDPGQKQVKKSSAVKPVASASKGRSGASPKKVVPVQKKPINVQKKSAAGRPARR